MNLAAKGKLTLESAKADTTLAAAKTIVIQTAGGASITLDGGITVACPGTITVKASKKSFVGAAKLAATLPNLPKPPKGPYSGRNTLHKAAGLNGRVFAGYKYQIEVDGQPVASGKTDEQGSTAWVDTDNVQGMRTYKQIMRDDQRIMPSWMSALNGLQPKPQRKAALLAPDDDYLELYGEEEE
jgi:uncharacterized protein (DUF2345 family)